MTNLDKALIRYIGKGSGTIPGVPARNMSYDEAKVFDISALIKSGLYELERPKKPYFKKVEPAPEAEEKDGE